MSTHRVAIDARRAHEIVRERDAQTGAPLGLSLGAYDPIGLWVLREFINDADGKVVERSVWLRLDELMALRDVFTVEIERAAKAEPVARLYLVADPPKAE